MSWRSFSLRDRMVRAIRKATIPVLFIQAENDYDLGPSRTLASELERLGKPHKLLIFPPYGNTHAEGHGVFCSQGMNVWGPAVSSFLDDSMGKWEALRPMIQAVTFPFPSQSNIVRIPPNVLARQWESSPMIMKSTLVWRRLAHIARARIELRMHRWVNIRCSTPGTRSPWLQLAPTKFLDISLRCRCVVGQVSSGISRTTPVGPARVTLWIV